MEHKNRIVSWSFFIILLCIYFMIDFVKASEDHSNRFPSKAYMINEAIKDRSKNRSLLEQDGIGYDACAGILGPNWRNVTKPINNICPKLFVWVPKNQGFNEFVKVDEQPEVEGGFSIAIFCHALQSLSFNIQPIFIPFVNEKGESKGNYDLLIRHIEKQTCEAVAGDVTIRFNRTQYVRFTTPYLSSEVYMVVHGAQEWNQTLLTFIKPFTWRLWITIIGVCIFIGVAIAILEHRVGNPKFAIPFYQKLIMIIWFPISTFYFHEGKILNRCSKVVLIMWLSMIFIVVQIFTATLSSWLTLNQLHPSLPPSLDKVGYQEGAFLEDFIKNCNQYNFGDNPVALKGVEDIRNALSNGSVNVYVDELPYIELFLAKYGADYMKFGPIQGQSGLAFAFPHESPFIEEFSKEVINVTESEIMMRMMEEYLGFSTDKSQPNQPLPQSLDVQSFIGLFVFIGSVTIAAIIFSEISLLCGNKKIIPIRTVS